MEKAWGEIVGGALNVVRLWRREEARNVWLCMLEASLDVFMSGTQRVFVKSKKQTTNKVKLRFALYMASCKTQ
jgi:hypothetical protein